ncbi:alpha/beta fold hydrolase [Billgrantia antri]|uniref:Alpha/beta hydrolase n=1 Tax=Billgrantia antri TaxID=2846777 RepID=A0ABS6ZHQ1_9GAMM|nr:alpha/beta hydrolase [Halomonas antri]MBW6389589.1 alpha/beta hydrolase [Halomonas antri]
MNPAHSLSLAEGRLAALAWGREDVPTWLALHGWLDNAASFSRLAPLLVERLGIRLVALDFVGHGHSEHCEGDYALWDYCHDLLDAADELGLERVSLLAHSMGAGVACLTAAALPERIEQLVLIDGLGAVTTPAAESAVQLRKGLLAARRTRSVAPRYPDSKTAVAARVAGGVTPIDADTATPLVERNLIREADGHVRLRTDGRLLWPSPVRLSPEQALALLGAIKAPLLLIEGERGILGERDMARAARAAVPQLRREVLPGGHHLHLEPESVDAVAEAIANWQVAP